MEILFNNSIIYENQTISLINDYTNKTYQIVCASINSKPDVSLSLYDKNTLIPLSNSLNSIVENSCSSTNLCKNILQVNLVLEDNRFNALTSIACSANSSNVNVPLNSYIFRNTSVFLVCKLSIV